MAYDEEDTGMNPADPEADNADTSAEDTDAGADSSAARHNDDN